MTIDEAIEILTYWLPKMEAQADPLTLPAYNLSIEALKEVVCLRSTDRTLVRPLLPGETEE